MVSGERDTHYRSRSPFTHKDTVLTNVLSSQNERVTKKQLKTARNQIMNNFDQVHASELTVHAQRYAEALHKKHVMQMQNYKKYNRKINVQAYYINHGTLKFQRNNNTTKASRRPKQLVKNNTFTQETRAMQLSMA